MSDMIDRVATAIGNSLYGYCDKVETPNTWAAAESAAQAALDAMQEPFDGLSEVKTYSINYGAAEIWAMMIDVARQPERQSTEEHRTP